MGVKFNPFTGQLDLTGSGGSGGGGITDLIGDVTASGSGTVTATVEEVGGALAADVASATSDVQAATSSNTPDTLVKRDGSGNFSAGTITATLNGVANNIAPAGTSGQVLKSNGLSAPAFADISFQTILHVDKSGNDSTGNGSITRPYLTVAAAMAAVSSPSTSNRYAIKVGTGTFTESTLTLKPYTWIIGTGGMTMGGPSRISVSSNAITLDSSWATGSQRGGLSQIYLTGSTGITFDRQAISGAGSTVLELFDVGMNGSLTFKSNQSTLDFLDMRAIRIFGSLLMSGGALQIFDSEILGNATLDNSGAQNLAANIYNSIISGNLTATSSGSNTITLGLSGVNLAGTKTFSGPSTTVNTDLDVFIPSVSADWPSVPDTVNEALDDIAALLSVKGPVTLTDNSSGVVLGYPHSNNKFTFIDYSIERSSSLRCGRLLIVNDSSSATIADNGFVEQGPVGISFGVQISGANVQLTYSSTSTGNNASFKYTIKQWS